MALPQLAVMLSPHQQDYLVWNAIEPPHTPSMLAPHSLPATVFRCLQLQARTETPLGR
jgi:hypothetical protein